MKAAAFVFGLALFFSIPETTLASSPQSEYCSNVQDVEQVLSRAQDPQQRMAFKNAGGLFNGGTCWWHSLYQRAAWYLTVFRPELPKPTQTERKFLVHQIARGKDVVELPGYKNFYEFSADNRDLIQEKLDQWQLTDGVLKFAWIDGLMKPKSLPPPQMSNHMRELTEAVELPGRIQWAMWQVPGIVAHASLYLEAYRRPTGYDYDIVDSNYPWSTDLMSFVEGASVVQTYFGPIVPHQGRHSDFRRFERAVRRYCASGPRFYTTSEKFKILSEPLNNDME